MCVPHHCDTVKRAFHKLDRFGSPSAIRTLLSYLQPPLDSARNSLFEACPPQERDKTNGCMR
jgi:hypothetical protein